MTAESKHDCVAKIYDEIRPSYPVKLIKEVVKDLKNANSTSILEIGAGTGKATECFAKTGHNIDCVELGENLANILIQKCRPYSNVDVFIEAFETWEAKAGHLYDLIYSAQAFHWIDQDVKYSKCHALLKPHGKIGLFWYQPITIENELTKSIRKTITAHCPNYYNSDKSNEINESIEETIKKRKTELIESNLFLNIEQHEYIVENELSVTEYISALKSFSKFASLEIAIRNKIVNDLEDLFIQSNCTAVSSNLKYYLFLGGKKSV